MPFPSRRPQDSLLKSVLRSLRPLPGSTRVETAYLDEVGAVLIVTIIALVPGLCQV